jgi:hypothetical protein
MINKIEDLPGEEWREIEGFPDYMVSNMGRVKGVGKKFNRKHSRCDTIMEVHRKPNLLKLTDHGQNGYMSVGLYNPAGEHRIWRVNRLVAQIFIPNPENKPVVNHLNYIRGDNRVENLEWCTVEENNKHAFLRKDRNTARGEQLSLLSEAQVLFMYENLDRYSNAEFADMFKVSRNTISHILRGRTWKHISIKFPNAKSGRHGEKHPRSKLKADQVLKIRELRLNNISRVKVAKMFNVSYGCIKSIDIKESWHHL